MTPGGEQRVRYGIEGLVLQAQAGLAPERTPFGQLLPELQRGVEDEQVDVAMDGERLEHLEVRGRQAREAEDRDPRREVDGSTVGSQALARVCETLGRA